MPTITTRQFRYAGQRNGALFFLSLASALALSACGGNGDVSLPETPAAAAAAAKKAAGTIEGAWVGNITVNEVPEIAVNPTNNTAPAVNVSFVPATPTPQTYAVATLVLGDGTLWSLYGKLPSMGNGFVLQGFHHAASGSISGLAYNSSTLNWYSGFSKNYTGTIDANVTPLGTLNATGTPVPVQQPPQLQAFNITALPFDASVYDYNKTTTLADIANSKWSATLVGGGMYPSVSPGFSIDSQGVVTGSTNGCDFTGSATPHATKNYFNLTVTADPMTCGQYSGTTLTGILIKVRVRVANFPEWDQLLGGLTSADGSTGGVFYSTNGLPPQ